MAGFHIGARGKAAGRVVRCSAKRGACKLMGADGEPTPHFSSLAEGEAFLASRDSAQRGGFTGPADSECESAAPGGGVGGGLLSVEAEMVHSCACCDPVDGPHECGECTGDDECNCEDCGCFERNYSQWEDDYWD